MMKKFCIVEFKDGLHLVPTLWISDDQLTCIWPDHLRSQFQINKAISRQLLPENVEDWETLNVVRTFGEAGMLSRIILSFFAIIHTEGHKFIRSKNEVILVFF